MEEYKEIYSKNQAEHIASEFSKLKDNYYLEHVGATIYSDVQIANVFKDLKNNLFGNPHAFNNSSKFTEDVVDQVRYQVLEHFNTNLDEYSIIFTSGATAALKLVAESFNYSSTNSTTNNEANGTFMYLEDNHISVLGMREYAKDVKILSHAEAFKIFNTSKSQLQDIPIENGQSLFVYPAQCNFSGTKHPLSWIDKVQNGVLNTLPQSIPTNWFCMLDAASLVSCNKLDLKQFKPDFVCLSFYKIFGYPTGLGALLVKNTSGHVLNKTYFGGGTVQMTLHSEHILRPILHERFEDGTLPFLSITSVRHGFETFKRLSLDMDLISTHTFSLAKYVHHSLLLMHHSNGSPIAVLYHDTNFENKNYQGAIVNFNLLRANGKYIGYSEVLQMANLYHIHLRTGCFCNPGACQRHLKLSPADVKQHFEAGHVCGDQNDLIDGYPTGSIRISFGYMSTKRDADRLLQMIQDCFLLKPVRKIIPSTWLQFEKQCQQKFYELSDQEIFVTNNNKAGVKRNTDNNRHIENVIKENNIKRTSGILQYIFVYPIKSCGAFSVSKSWTIEPTGFSYDREWMIITSAGVCLTQKQEPRMCLVMPVIKTDEGLMELHFPNMQPIIVPLDVGECIGNSEVSLCQSKVCGDRVRCFDCGDEVAYWLSEALERSDLRLVRQNSNHIRTNRKGEQSQLSLANQAQYLLLNIASVRYLANSIQDYEGYDKDISNLIHRFRANIVIDTNSAFIENSSDKITIGNHEFKCTGPCTRCQMICIDQTTGEKTIEPLRTLSVLTESKIRFGIYLAHISSTDSSLSIHESVNFQ